MILDNINDLKSKGYSRRQIASILEISEYTVSKYLPGEINPIGQQIIDLRLQQKTVLEISKELNCSKSTVSKWIRFAPENDQLICENIDKKRRKQDNNIINVRQERLEHNTSKDDNYRSWKQEIRRKRLIYLKSIFGSCCNICGYNKTLKALHFHHKQDTEKLFEISGVRAEWSMERLLNEVQKCVLLCSNCHVEVHDNLVCLPNNFVSIPSLSEVPSELVSFIPNELDEVLKKKEFDWINDQLKRDEIEIIDKKYENLDLSKLETQPIQRQKLDALCKKHHYLRQSHKGGIYSLGFFNEKELIGCALITNPVRQGSDGYCEISRFLLLGEYKNLASRALSLVIKFLKQQDKWLGVQSFADNSIHLGTIYKAANFKSMGCGSETYNYNGIHKKTIYMRARMLGISEHEYAKIFNLNRIKESAKTKFIYDF